LPQKEAEETRLNFINGLLPETAADRRLGPIVKNDLEKTLPNCCDAMHFPSPLVGKTE
jgi:hypothetical protein